MYTGGAYSTISATVDAYCDSIRHQRPHHRSIVKNRLLWIILLKCANRIVSLICKTHMHFLKSPNLVEIIPIRWIKLYTYPTQKPSENMVMEGCIIENQVHISHYCIKIQLIKLNHPSNVNCFLFYIKATHIQGKNRQLAPITVSRTVSS